MKKTLSLIFSVLVLSAGAVFADVIRYNPERVKVYIPPKNPLSVTMKHSFMDWQRHTNNKIVFDYVGTKSTANIEVEFVDNGINKICGGNALGCNVQRFARTTRGNLKPVYSKLYISMRDNKGRRMTNNQVYTIMLHEVGHSLGLQHSYDDKSLMFPVTNRNMAEGQEIRQEDVDAVLKIYGLKN